MESTSKIFRIRIENYAFGCNLIYEIWISDGPSPATGGPSDSQIMSPGGECFAPYGFPRGLALLLEDLLIRQLCPLEESASHHMTVIVKSKNVTVQSREIRRRSYIYSRNVWIGSDPLSSAPVCATRSKLST